MLCCPTKKNNSNNITENAANFGLEMSDSPCREPLG